MESPSREEQLKTEPTVYVSIVVFPLIAANFITDENGGNRIADSILDMMSQVLDATKSKIGAVASAYCDAAGIKLSQLSDERALEAVKKMLLSDKPLGYPIRGVVGKDGEISFDKDLTDAVIKGERTDN